MKMKKLSLALIAAGFMSSQVAMAGGDFATTESQKGLSFAFENSATMNYETLSHTEMVETEGEWIWLPYLALSALGGLFIYGVSTDENERTVGGAVTAAATSGVMGVTGYAVKGAVGVGAAIGAGGVTGYTTNNVVNDYIPPEDRNGNNTNFSYEPPGNANYGPGRTGGGF